MTAEHQRVIAFIGKLSENGVLDTDRIGALAEKSQTVRSAEETALMYQRSLTDVTSMVDTALGKQYIVNGRDHLILPFMAGIVFLGITIVLLLVAPMVRYITGPALVFWIVVLVQVVIAFAAPSTLFGHWKNDGYKKKLEWDAFAHFLSDMAMIQKYAPADLSMWGDWLIYGTALGIGEKVEKAMQLSMSGWRIPVSLSGLWE